MSYGDINPFLFWHMVSDARMALSATAEGLNEFKECGSALTSRGEPDLIHELGFEETEEALYGCIVETIYLLLHRGNEAVQLKVIQLLFLNRKLTYCSYPHQTIN